MNFDPDESLMAHAFGLPVESGLAGFSERRDELTAAELDAVCAAIAVSSVPAVPPAAHSLAVIRARLNLPGRRSWQGFSSWLGWSVAAVLAGLMAVNGIRPGGAGSRGAESTTGSAEAKREVAAGTVTRASSAGGEGAGEASDPAGELSVDPAPPEARGAVAAQDAASDSPGTAEDAPPAAETGDLLAEIEALRSRLSRIEELSIAHYIPPGADVSWPVVIAMRPPDSADTGDSRPLVSRIADILTDGPSAARVAAAEDSSATGPTGIQIYDPARDAGTLTFRNLPPAPAGMEYSLWVTAAGSSTPTYVGPLPRDLNASDAVDFSLDTTGFVPAGISVWLNPEPVRTLDGTAATAAPSLDSPDAVMVLQGP